MSGPTLFRIIPFDRFVVRRPHRILERQWMVMTGSNGWIVVVAGIFEPLFYLLSMRIGFGALVGDVSIAGRVIPYAEFVAPALLASAAMNGAVFESTFNIFFKLKHDKIYDAVLSTPMTVGDIAVGEVLNCTARGAFHSSAFLVTMAGLGMVGSWWALLILPVGVLLAMAFSALGIAATTYMRSWVDFEYIPTVTLPLFLFSATFYPVSSYGELAWVANLSPLYHGVALCRGLNIGDVGWWMLGHVGVLISLFLFGVTVAAARIHKLILD